VNTLADILDERHQRRLAGLRACGPRFSFVVATLGGARDGQDPDPAQLAEGLRRLAQWSGRRFGPADLDVPLGWLRLGRLVAFFFNMVNRLRPFAKKLFPK
jgi:hypothetical protein